MSTWDKPFQLEMNVAHLVSEQAKHGCNFNSPQAHRNVFFLIEKIINIDRELIPLLPPMLNKGTEYNRPFKLNGDFMKWPGEYAARVGLERKDVANRFTGVWYTPFDPSKTDKVKHLMIDLGWVPTEWNSKKVLWDANKIKREIGKATTYVDYFKKLPPDVRMEFHKPIQAFFEKHILVSTVSDAYRKLYLGKIGCYTKKEIARFNEVVNNYCSHAYEVVEGRKSTVVISQDAMTLRKKVLRDLLDKGFKTMLCKGFWDSSPKITEDSFDSLDDSESKVLALLRQRMVWAHRRSLIQGLIENMKKRPVGWHVVKSKNGKMTLRKYDGKLSGELNPCATPTARGRHRVIVNIPASGAPFGNECRDMFTGDKRYDVDQYKPYNQRSKEEKGTIFYNDPIKKAGLKGFKHPEFGLVFTNPNKSVFFKVEFDKKTKFKKKVVIIKKLKGDDFVNAYRIDKHRNRLIEWDDGKWDERGAHAWRYFIPPGHDAFVGGDGAALELRMLAHYLNYVPTMLLKAMDEQGVDFVKAYGKNFTRAQLNEAKHSAEEYRHQVLSGDIHTHNQKLAGLPTRKAAKSFIYAFLNNALIIGDFTWKRVSKNRVNSGETSLR